MIFRHIILLAPLVLTSACSSTPSIPLPTLQVNEKDSTKNIYDGLAAPMQKAWHWDADRWFEAEVDHRCFGAIRFVDQKKGINSFVGIIDVPHITFDSDDPDVILAAVGAYEQLIFSVDGGRNFLKEVRGFPSDVILEFIAVRKGNIYVGFQNVGRNPDGYFDWKSYDVPFGQNRSIPIESKLVIIEAKLDKNKGAIDSYQILAPRGYKFVQGAPPDAESYIKRIDNIESLKLPHGQGSLPSDACKTTMKLPFWKSMWSSKDLEKFVMWYEATKQANPGWADVEKDQFVEYVRKKYEHNQ